MNFILRDIEIIDDINSKRMTLAKKEGFADLLPYADTKCKKMDFTISRNDSDKYDGYDLSAFCNVLRTYMDMRTAVSILTFDFNQDDDDNNITMNGLPCMIQQIRSNLNSVIIRQNRSDEYELKIVNNSPYSKRIYTGDIKLKGSKNGKHNNFAPGICIGYIEPDSSIHIKTIYIDTSTAYTDTISSYVNGVLTTGIDSTHYSNNGWTKYFDLNMDDEDPHMVGASAIRMGTHIQPYRDPMDILQNAILTLLDDLKKIDKHNKASLGKPNKDGTINYQHDRCTILRKKNGDVICVLKGFMKQLGYYIVAQAPVLFGDKATHFSVKDECVTKKNIMIRFSGSGEIFDKCLELAMDRASNILEQLTS